MPWSGVPAMTISVLPADRADAIGGNLDCRNAVAVGLWPGTRAAVGMGTSPDNFRAGGHRDVVLYLAAGYRRADRQSCCYRPVWHRSRTPSCHSSIRVRLAAKLDGYFYFHGARGAFLLQLNRTGEARVAFDRAIALATTPAEAAHIRQQLDRLADNANSGRSTPKVEKNP